MTTPPTEQVRRGLRRRTVLVGAGAGATAVAAGAWFRLAAGGVPTDGPPLAELPDLPVRRAADGTLEASLVAAPSGTGLAYNGTAPGPVLRLREGDRVRLHFRNDTDADSSLHLHGIPLTPAVDRPLAHLAPGGSDVREFTVVEGSAGTYWYHPHAHGDVERQVLAGLVGALVVTGPLDDDPAVRRADDRLVVLTSSGSTVLANGAERPVAQVASGLTRLRLVNATPGEHLLIGLVGEDGGRRRFHLVATDGGAVEEPVELRELLLAPGERAEVLVDTTQPGATGVQRLEYSAYGPGGPTNDEETLFALVSRTRRPAVPLPPRLRPLERLDATDAVTERRVVLDAAGGLFTVDGRTFDMHRVDARARLGTLEVWEVVNEHTTDHPFHLHSYSVQVLDRDGVPEPFRAWRDTVNVPAGSRVRLLVPFRGGPGRTVYHCHVLNHEDLGMMAVLHVTA